MIKETLSGKHYKRELKFMLDNELSAVFLVRMIYESCHVFDVGFSTNASAYCLLAKQEIGKQLMNTLKQIDIEKFNKAEKTYLKIVKDSAEKQKKENENV